MRSSVPALSTSIVRRARRRAGPTPRIRIPMSADARRRPPPRAPRSPPAWPWCRRRRGSRRPRVSPSPIARDQRGAVADRLVGRGAQGPDRGPDGAKRVTRRPTTRVAEAAHDLGRPLGLRLARDPQRHRAGAHVGRRVEGHVLDVDPGAAQRQRDLGHGAGPVLDRDPELAQLATRELGLEQAAAILAGRACARPRRRRASPERISSAASRRRSETASTSRGDRLAVGGEDVAPDRRVRTGDAGRVAKARADLGKPLGLLGLGAAASRTSTLAITWGTWLTVAISRSWVSASMA